MRLPAKNATARLAAIVLAMTGATEAAGQNLKEQLVPSLPDGGPDAGPVGMPERGRSPRAPALPSAVPLARDAEGVRPDAGERRFQSDAGLRGRLWIGTPYSLVAEALPRLPVRIASPVIRRLTLEILTVPVDPVDGAAIAARIDSLRAERLHAMGQLEAADAVFRATPVAKGDPARAPAEIETTLLLHGPRAACEVLARHMAVRSSPYLDRASIACHALAGDHGKAALGLDRLRERGVAVGEVFAGLVLAQQPELARPLRALGRADAWSVRLLAETRLAWPGDAAWLHAPALLRVVAESGNDPTAVRIAAAERAFLLGALDGEKLAALYASVRFREAASSRADGTELAYGTPIHRALLYQAALRERDRRLRVEILTKWWHAARHDRSEALAALITAPLVLDLAPGAAWQENAAALSRVFFYAGELERALHWYGWIRDATFKDMDAYIRLSALARLAESNGVTWTPRDARAWTEHQRERPGAAGDRRIALMRALEEGLGAAAHGGPAVAGALGRSEADALDDWRNVQVAARAGRHGEAILLMLTALGHDGVARAEPRALGAAVGVLAALGRGTEARRLAIEAALANGF
jgi:hypothetical protein